MLVLSTDVYKYSSGYRTGHVNKYSLASASCQPIWRTLVGELDLFLAVAKDCGIVVYLKPITIKHLSVFWLVSQSRRMSAICVGICRWISLAAASADPVVLRVTQSLEVMSQSRHFSSCAACPLLVRDMLRLLKSA